MLFTTVAMTLRIIFYKFGLKFTSLIFQKLFCWEKETNHSVTNLLGLDTIHKGIDCGRHQKVQNCKNDMDAWRHLLANAVS